MRMSHQDQARVSVPHHGEEYVGGEKKEEKRHARDPRQRVFFFFFSKGGGKKKNEKVILRGPYLYSLFLPSFFSSFSLSALARGKGGPKKGKKGLCPPLT